MVVKTKRRQHDPLTTVHQKRRKVALSEPGRSSLLSTIYEPKACGAVLTLGVGDTGQLGLGPNVSERSKPTCFSQSSLLSANLKEESAEEFIQIVAGGMHTVCLTKDGLVYTFGCNDEGALGRLSVDESPTKLVDITQEVNEPVPIEESRPGLVQFPNSVKISMISAGDSHTAALDTDGVVWLWGTFRGSSGVLGLTQADEISKTPQAINSFKHQTGSSRIIKIASGHDHLVCLTECGRLLTMGCGEQGQLGRISERFSKDGGRNGLELLLQPAECRIRGTTRFSDVWAGGFGTIARTTNGIIYACGLNNYGQLALISESNNSEQLEISKDKMDQSTDNRKLTEDEVQLSSSQLITTQEPLVQYMLTPAMGFEPTFEFIQFALGMHHTLALTKSGVVYSVGRSDYGRLGYPITSQVDASAISQPQRVNGDLTNHKCCWIACGEACSFAVDDQGVAYSWGMGSSQQLAQKDDEEDVLEPLPMLGNSLLTRRVLMIDAGGQHTVLLAQDPSQSPKSSVSTLHTNLCDSMDNTVCLSNDLPVVQNEQSVMPFEKLDLLSNHQQMQPPENIVINQCKQSPSKINDDPEQPQTTKLESAIKNALLDQVNCEIGNTNHPIISPFNIDYKSTESVTASTAGATVNSSSLHSCSIVSSQPISDATSSCSNASTESASSGHQNSSAHSTDGGGSSRLSSLGGASVQSSLFTQPVDETVGIDHRVEDSRRRFLPRFPVQSTRASFGGGSFGGMSIGSTSSEPGFPTDTMSLGSMTASPMDLVSGETGPSGGFPLS